MEKLEGVDVGRMTYYESLMRLYFTKKLIKYHESIENANLQVESDTLFNTIWDIHKDVKTCAI